MAATRTFLQAAADTSDASSYTFSSQNLGAADAGRFIVVCVNSRSTNAGLSVSTVTVAGVSCAINVQATRTTSAESVAAIAIAAVPTGTTGDVVVTLSVSALRCGIEMYYVLGIDGTTASDTDSDIANNDPSMSLDVPANGLAIATSNSAFASDSSTWSGLTEDHDAQVGTESLVQSCASDEFASLQTGLAVSDNWATGTNAVAVVASWAPAAGGAVLDERRFPRGVMRGVNRGVA